jgi:isopenicillin N synthase-like dioxygenase
MDKAGKAWRGYFPVGYEFTSGKPDQKEGVYFSTHLDKLIDEQKDETLKKKLAAKHDRILHGNNFYPAYTVKNTDGKLSQVSMQAVVDEYMNEMKKLGTILMQALTQSLNLSTSDSNFSFEFDDPVELFRIFNYPPHDPKRFGDDTFGVGTHTDYGFITILKQDNSGGLQIQKLTENNDGTISTAWIDAKPVDNSFVINLGDCLERMTGGLYRATPHRVLPRKNALKNRLSFPYFFDPNFDSLMKSAEEFITDEKDIELMKYNRRLVGQRWDSKDPALFRGTYAEYLVQKIEKVFPELAAKELQKFRQKQQLKNESN